MTKAYHIPTPSPLTPNIILPFPINSHPKTNYHCPPDSQPEICFLKTNDLTFLQLLKSILNPSPAEPRYVLSLQTEANWSGSALFAIEYVNL